MMFTLVVGQVDAYQHWYERIIMFIYKKRPFWTTALGIWLFLLLAVTYEMHTDTHDRNYASYSLCLSVCLFIYLSVYVCLRYQAHTLYIHSVAKTKQ